MRSSAAAEMPAEVSADRLRMAQMGHESSALALEVYTKVMERKRDTGTRMDALIRGVDWAEVTKVVEATRT
jgi:hypothetical protein